MTSFRVVTVPTRDHGDVDTLCPTWCTGDYHQVNGWRVDITHTSAEQELKVPTSSGPAVVLRFVFEQRPFTDKPLGTRPFVSVEIDGDWYPMGPHALDALAQALVDRAAEVRVAARQLLTLLAKEHR
ncbi:DUF6907 domain-containing protein [Streptomyces sp. NPDC051310]|uniref:DUF6907 domain-containing protein n=1 Tax=Streptomyces sp. NPDC051310 TaxID=3365649 RepID=UPI0037A0C0B7